MRTGGASYRDQVEQANSIILRMDTRGILSGSQILLEARILAIADVVEAMASHRPYRSALGVDVALEEIAGNSGRLYDTEAGSACLKLFRENGFAFR